MPRLRMITFFSLVCTQVALVALGPILPESLAPVSAGTVYLPLWPLSSIGLPVFGRAESGGWPGPNVLGWLFVVVIWSALWWMLATAISKVRA
jgi:hypothetical protein